MEHNLLKNLNLPSDLKKLDEKELGLLSEEIRDKIITTVSETGGHLASNLGAVELTIALHKVLIHLKIKLSGTLDIRFIRISSLRADMMIFTP